MPGLYRLLAPGDLTLMVDGKLLKLDSHKVEFLFCQLMIALFYTALANNVTWRHFGFRAGISSGYWIRWRCRHWAGR